MRGLCDDVPVDVAEEERSVELETGWEWGDWSVTSRWSLSDVGWRKQVRPDPAHQ